MPKGASARRHAQAVFQIASESGEMQKWQEDLDTLAIAFGDSQFKLVLESPRVRLDDKLELVRRQSAQISSLALNLACFLVAKGRVGIAEEVAQEYRRLLNSHRGLQTAEIVSAVPLDDQKKDQIAKRLSEATDKEIILSTSVVPQITGGLVIKLGDQLTDGSTQAKLKEMRKVLVEQRI